MTVFALAMVIVAGLLHAFWNIVAKNTGGNRHFVLMGSLLAALFWAPTGLWFGWRDVPRWSAIHWTFMALSGFLHLAYFRVLLNGYQRWRVRWPASSCFMRCRWRRCRRSRRRARCRCCSRR